MPEGCLIPMFVNVGERLLLTFWAGSLWTVGYVVAPTLFAVLDDRQLAGLLAGRLFEIVAYLGLFCGVLLLIGQVARSGWKGWRVYVVLSMLVLTAIGQFVLQPRMAALKSEGIAAADRFAMLHGVSSTVFLVVSLLALALVAFGIAADRNHRQHRQV